MEVRITGRPGRTWRAVAAVLAVAALAAAACSGGSDDASSTSTTSVAAGGDGALTVVEDGLDPLTTERLNTAATASFAEISAPGAVMAVRTPQGAWIATIGYQDWDETAPMAADVNQRVGSVTKTFTVTALLQLAEQGRLSLDDPIDMYVPGMPNPQATLGSLAAMRSGIPSYTFDEGFQQILFGDPDYVWTPQALVDIVKGQEPMFPPGTQTFYSNTNTILLGMVIEQVTGEPLGEVIQRQIIGPLGLADTVFPLDSGFPEPHAQGYTTQGQDDGRPADATDWNPSWGWAAGAMISNLDDLLVYAKELVAGDTLLTPDWQDRRIQSFDFSIPPNSPTRAYGLGLGLAYDWYGHTGELPGYNTVIQHNLTEDMTLVVMVNSDIKSGDCPPEAPTTPGGRTTGPCEDPAVHIANTLADALGFPLVPPQS